jgi:hypothetical protein
MNTVVTSARPIMRAEAVFEVRSGFRTALALASRPATRKSGAMGRPMLPAMGTATTGLSWATPMNTARAPMPRSATTVMVSSATQSPAVTRPAPTNVSSAPDQVRRVLDHPVGTKPSRIPCTGGTLDARRAGASDAISVTPNPTTTAAATVRRSSTRP